MRVALVLVTEGPMAHLTPNVLLSRLKVLVHLLVALETEQTCHTRKLMSDVIVVLKVVFETPLIFECTETKVAEDVMAQRIIHVVFEAIPILENSRTKVAVVLVILRLLDVALQCGLVVELLAAHATPVLMLIVGLVACTRRGWRCRCDRGGARLGLWGRTAH